MRLGEAGTGLSLIILITLGNSFRRKAFHSVWLCQKTAQQKFSPVLEAHL